MSLLRVSIIALAIVLGTTGLSCVQPASASDNFPRSSRIDPLSLSLSPHERIPIGIGLAHPDRYQMREIRLSGTVTAVQTEIITNRLICGRAHERTRITVEDESGQIETVDQGSCGRNPSALKAPMLKVGQQADFLVLIMIPTGPGAPDSSMEATIRFVDLARN